MPARKLLPPKKGFGPRLRRFFARGLAVILPTLVTVAILVWAYHLLDAYLASHVNNLVKAMVTWLTPYSREQIDGTWQTYQLGGWIGLVATVVLVLLLGMLVASFFGRALWRLFEGIMLRVPLIKQIYPHVKQVTDFLLSEQPIDFSRVVLAEYPRKGCWSMGFVVNRSFPELSIREGGDWAVVFIPSSPTPVTGYVIQLRKDEIIDLDLSVDQALRFTITCGVVLPAASAVTESAFDEPLLEGQPAG